MMGAAFAPPPAKALYAGRRASASCQQTAKADGRHEHGAYGNGKYTNCQQARL